SQSPIATPTNSANVGNEGSPSLDFKFAAGSQRVTPVFTPSPQPVNTPSGSYASAETPIDFPLSPTPLTNPDMTAPSFHVEYDLVKLALKASLEDPALAGEIKQTWWPHYVEEYNNLTEVARKAEAREFAEFEGVISDLDAHTRTLMKLKINA